jgi:hypothetical protein
LLVFVGWKGVLLEKKQKKKLHEKRYGVFFGFVSHLKKPPSSASFHQVLTVVVMQTNFAVLAGTVSPSSALLVSGPCVQPRDDHDVGGAHAVSGVAPTGENHDSDDARPSVQTADGPVGADYQGLAACGTSWSPKLKRGVGAVCPAVVDLTHSDGDQSDAEDAGFQCPSRKKRLVSRGDARAGAPQSARHDDARAGAPQSARHDDACSGVDGAVPGVRSPSFGKARTDAAVRPRRRRDAESPSDGANITTFAPNSAAPCRLFVSHLAIAVDPELSKCPWVFLTNAGEGGRDVPLCLLKRNDAGIAYLAPCTWTLADLVSFVNAINAVLAREPHGKCVHLEVDKRAQRVATLVVGSSLSRSYVPRVLLPSDVSSFVAVVVVRYDATPQAVPRDSCSWSTLSRRLLITLALKGREQTPWHVVPLVPGALTTFPILDTWCVGSYDMVQDVPDVVGPTSVVSTAGFSLHMACFSVGHTVFRANACKGPCGHGGNVSWVDTLFLATHSTLFALPTQVNTESAGNTQRLCEAIASKMLKLSGLTPDGSYPPDAEEDGTDCPPGHDDVGWLLRLLEPLFEGPFFQYRRDVADVAKPTSAQRTFPLLDTLLSDATESVGSESEESAGPPRTDAAGSHKPAFEPDRSVCLTRSGVLGRQRTFRLLGSATGSHDQQAMMEQVTRSLLAGDAPTVGAPSRSCGSRATPPLPSVACSGSLEDTDVKDGEVEEASSPEDGQDLVGSHPDAWAPSSCF